MSREEWESRVGTGGLLSGSGLALAWAQELDSFGGLDGLGLANMGMGRD